MHDLSPEHRQSLVDGSGIAEATLAERGYCTVARRTELERLGFGAKQRLVPGLLIPIWSVWGELTGYQLRPDYPRVVDGKVRKYELPPGTHMVLDVHPQVRHLLAVPSVPLWVTEGIKKGDALASRGLCAAALLGVWSWRGTNSDGGKTALPDWEAIALNGRRVFLVFDSDVMLKAPVYQALGRLGAFLVKRGADVFYVYLPNGAHGEKVGVDDFLAQGHSIEELNAFATPDLRPLSSDASDGAAEDADDQASQATLLVRLAMQADIFHDPLGDAYAAVAIDGHRETWAVRSSAFRHWLTREFYTTHGMAPRGATMADALGVIEGQAQFAGDERQVWVRVAQGSDGALYLDLGTPIWDAVRITTTGWDLVADPPVHFRRSPATAALPKPVRGGSLRELQRLLTLPSEDDFVRIAGWLVGALRPKGPYPVLVFIAEQGAGKTLTARFVRDLVDPSPIDLRGMPHGERDLVITARTAHVLAYDNVSTLPGWLSDAICRLATGAGWATRTLYTDAEETVFSQCRPVVLTGIEDFISNGDLLDRALLVNLVRMPPERRRRVQDLEREYAMLRPALLGALLDAVVIALAQQEAVDLPELPRMADFAAWVVAAEPALPWTDGQFLRAFCDGAQAGQAIALEASLLTIPLVTLAMQQTGGISGTAAVLLEQLSAQVPEDVRRRPGWPKSPRAFGSALRRIAPALREVHQLEVSFSRDASPDRTRIIRIAPAAGWPGATVQTVQTVHRPPPTSADPDGLDDLDATPVASAPSVDAPRHGEAWEEVIA